MIALAMGGASSSMHVGKQHNRWAAGQVATFSCSTWGQMMVYLSCHLPHDAQLLCNTTHIVVQASAGVTPGRPAVTSLGGVVIIALAMCMMGSTSNVMSAALMESCVVVADNVLHCATSSPQALAEVHDCQNLEMLAQYEMVWLA